MNTNHHPDNEELRGARLTAYALGQLGPEEKAAVEAELDRLEETGEIVKSTRTLASYLYEATCRDLSVRRSESLREAIELRLSELEATPMNATTRSAPANASQARRRRWCTGRGRLPAGGNRAVLSSVLCRQATGPDGCIRDANAGLA